MLKSVGIVVGSYVLCVLLVLASDPLLTKLFPGDYVRGHISSNAALLTSTAFFVLFSILTAWVCARFSPSNPAKHVLWFFVIGEIMGIASSIPNWGKGWPHWYTLAWLLSWPVSCYLGLMLGRRRSEQKALAATT